ncbi:uncharacterized protein ATNIH1004_009295 [Aspergillus tanneri]|uniref:Major facilitator superfamily (MFS) profile domain-containing protein n=1 Tax=Aspergillus tanneri TaxID=1220188 RepID=A0A5M9MJE9_9EURO|nr:uncharacterized protein ATNIH1004_009295 [Aspergillus tanneri]KAA8645083.1 hypothetical protein ATNIH1004_009295 [Aspergillus tanneri]
MQSYLQYRRLQHAVNRQLESRPRQLEWPIGVPQTDDLETPTTDSLNGETDQKRLGDPEKALSENVAQEIISLEGVQAMKLSDVIGSQPRHLFVVGWEGKDDALSPRNFSLFKRMIATLLVSILSFAVGAASSINAAVLPQSSKTFNVSEIAGSLVTGVFGSPPLTCAGGTIADLWSPLEKTFAFPFYAIFSFSGPILAPVIASFMGQGSLSWRWANWIILIMSSCVLGIVVFLQPETYSLLLLKWKAKHFRTVTGDSRFVSEMDMSHAELGPFRRIYGALKREFLLTLREPIVILISLYMTVIYIVIFTFFSMGTTTFLVMYTDYRKA